MYSFVNALCLGRSIGSQWVNKDISNILVFDIYASYAKVYLTLEYGTPASHIYVDMDTLRTEYSNYSQSLAHLLTDLGNRTLITVPGLPSSTIKYAKYSDAFRSEYKVDITKIGMYVPAGYPESELADLVITRPKYPTDLTLLHTHALMSVNGYYHMTDDDGSKAYIYDGAKSMRKSKNNHVGILSFMDIGRLAKVKIAKEAIFTQDSSSSLKDKLYFTVDTALDNKSYILVLGGYLVFPKDGVFWRSGDKTFALDLNKLPYIERIFESSSNLDFTSLALSDTGIGDDVYNAQELWSDRVIKNYMTMSQSFLVVIDKEYLATNKLHVRSSTLPGMFTAYQDPCYPLMVGYGRSAEYWKVREDDCWAINVCDSYLRNYVIASRQTGEMTNINSHLHPSRPFVHQEGYLLEIVGCDSSTVVPGGDVPPVDGTLSEQILLMNDTDTSNTEFGTSVAMSGDGTRLVACTVNGAAGSSLSNTGIGYVFAKVNSIWQMEATLVIDGTTNINDSFGYSVAISDDGTRVVIGAPYDESPDLVKINAGAAYIFTRSGTSWTQEAVLTAINAYESASLGYSVAIDSTGTRVVVGALLGTSSQLYTGTAYVFLRTGTVWTEEHEFIASDFASQSMYGVSVSINATGDTIAIGSIGADITGMSDVGAVYIYSRTGTTWNNEIKLLANDKAADVQLGISVSLSADGNILAVGAEYATITGILNAGAVYIFIRSDSMWSQSAKLVASNNSDDDNFGHSVSINNDGTKLLVGSPLASRDNVTNCGAAYIFTKSGSNWVETARLSASDKAEGAEYGNAVSLSGDGAYIIIGAHYKSMTYPGQGAVYVYS